MINNILNKLYRMSDFKWHQLLYTYGTIISLILFIISLLGISIVNLKYISSLRTILKVYISVILLIRFNPYMKYNKTDVQQKFDRKIAFSAGLFLLLTTTILDSLDLYFKSVRLDDLSTILKF